ncbi:hypothetical protein KIN20_031999 [Parelaphostrongylus tenuis]|uniref:Polycystin cation channel PKD1/PKD2 domain-containing protein n=1 Tax=Parelaphostrongylus tenuis TaxID=148309 RepID=A0AAD5R6C5_PARTN|nr:hypothetical protein KIN20_031999 [Parelaphostrongylus tenuis]
MMEPTRSPIIHAKVVRSFSREITQCFSRYDPSVEDKTSFGPANTEPYIWQSESVLSTRMHQGFIANYGGGGFVLRLPLKDSEAAAELLADVKSNRWIDRATRAVIIDFAMFNANVNLFCIARLLLELPATGGVLPSYRFSTYDLMRYFGSFGKMLIILEGMLLGFIIYYIVEEILLDLIRFRLKYLLSFWNVVDVTLFSLCFAAVFLNYDGVTTAAERVNIIIENVPIFHVFNYIGFNKTMNQLSATLSRSTKDIGGFAVMFAVFFFAYAQFGYLVFGSQKFSHTMLCAFRLLRFYSLPPINAGVATKSITLTSLYHPTYKRKISTRSTNMFLAIINDSYVEVKAELARQQEGQGIFGLAEKGSHRSRQRNQQASNSQKTLQ